MKYVCLAIIVGYFTCGLIACESSNELDNIMRTEPSVILHISSVNVIPTYSNGNVGVSNKGITKIRFEVLPLEAAQKLTIIDLSAFSLKAVSTIQSRSSNGGGILLPVMGVSFKDGEVIIETTGENLPSAFFQGIEGASCRLIISDGFNNVLSSYFGLTPDNTAGGFFFKIQDLKGNYYEPFLVEDNIIHVFIPKGIILSALNPVFIGGDIFMSSLGVEITGKHAFDFSDFTKPFTFRQITTDGIETNWIVNLYDLPVMIIDTPDNLPITSKKERKEGCSFKLVNQNGDVMDLGFAGIRGRGNSSWLQPKKPYNIKLDNKHEILGMKASKHWYLLANAFFDRTQLHNATAFEMARLTDFPWVQKGEFVELVLNGKHEGLYYLCEKIRIEKGKIDIKEIQPSDLDGESLTGGYLLESAIGDAYLNPIVTNYYNKTGRLFEYQLGWEFKHPEENIPQQQYDYVYNYLNKMESLIWDEDSLLNGSYRKYLDIESVINWWLVEEASLNEEATRTKNMFLYKDKGGKFVVGPPWDFDAWTFGLYGTNHFYCTKTAFYFENLLKDPYFVNRMKEKWEIYKPIWIDSIPKYIDSQFQYIHRSALRNDKMWPDFCPETMASEKTYEQNVADMKDSFFKQIKWMDNSIKNDYYIDWWDENDSPLSYR